MSEPEQQENMQTGAGSGASLPGDNGTSATQEQNAQAPQGKETEKQAARDEPYVPETYDYDVPQTWDGAYKEKVESIAKAHKLTNEQMKAFAVYAQKEHEAFMQERQNNMEKWESELKKDPDFAGENFNTAVQYAAAGLRHIDTDGSLAKVLEESGYGSHPAVVKAMHKIGKMLNNDSIVGKGGSAKDVPLWDRLYK